MIELPAIGPAQRHSAGLLAKRLTIGSDLAVAPEIAANLVEVIEIGMENLAEGAAPGIGTGAGKPSRLGARRDQHVEARIEEVEGQPAGRLQMPGGRRQALSLQVGGQQMLEGPKGH